jgi:hypothetical protein
LAETEKVRFDFGQDSAIGIVPVSKQIVDADVIISVPTMKTHLLTCVTLGMKNMYGCFPEEDKAKFHRFGIERVVFEVNKAFTPNLTIIDGTIGGEAYGPLSCKPVGLNTIIASNNVVSADSTACQIMGYNPLDVIHLKIAQEQGLGNAQMSFDFTSLPFQHAKDKNWEKPDPAVSALYEGLVEATLLAPGMQGLFDASADFVLYGMATLPGVKELTPEVERAFNIILSDILRALSQGGYVWQRLTEENVKKMQEFIISTGRSK